MIPMLASNDEFKAMHQRNLTREKNPLKKMQSIVALCGKLVRIVYALLTKGSKYDAVELTHDMNRSTKVAA